MSHPCFRWLHLSDLHFGQAEQPILWPNVKHAFWNDLKDVLQKSGPVNAVLFSGDMVFSGSDPQFGKMEQEFLRPLMSNLNDWGSKDAVLLAVPGNHDMRRPKDSAAFRILNSPQSFANVRSQFWGDTTNEYRRLIDGVFAGYSGWWERHTHGWDGKDKPPGIQEFKKGMLPGDFSATLEVAHRGPPPLRIGVVGLNSTFLQLGSGDYEGKLALDMQQAAAVCGEDVANWVEGHDACILMTHQGPHWLAPEYRDKHYNELNPAGRFAAHLYGHEHANHASSMANNGGLGRHFVQATSLFGLKKWGDAEKQDRRHGYRIGEIQFGGEAIRMRSWPRLAVNKGSNGWGFERDSNSTYEKADCLGTRFQVVELVLTRWKPASPEPEVRAPEPAAVRAAYLRHLQGECDVVWEPNKQTENGGADGQRERRLLDVHATQHTFRPKPDAPAVAQGRSPAGAGDESASGASAMSEVERVPVYHEAAAVERLALLGPPGGGKSTFLRWLALKLAGLDGAGSGVAKERVAGTNPAGMPMEKALSTLADCLPVWIELRRLPGMLPRGSERMPRLLAAHFAEVRRRFENCHGVGWKHVEQLMLEAYRHGRLLFLVDGLDEVTSCDGAAAGDGLITVEQGVRELLEWCPPGMDRRSAPRHRMILTCRSVAWHRGWAIDGWKEDHRGEVRELDLLRVEEQEAFLNAWFDDPARATRLVSELRSPVRNRGARLADMLAVPLNLTMVAWLAGKRMDAADRKHADDGGQPVQLTLALPATRAAIYEQVVYAILWEIDDAKGLGEGPQQTLSALVGKDDAMRHRFVQWLAREAFRGWDGLEEPAWRESILKDSYAKAMFGQRWERNKTKAQAVLSTLQLRAGILCMVSPGSPERTDGHRDVQEAMYGFVHRSFREYFMALHLLEPFPEPRPGQGEFAGRALGFWEECARRGLSPTLNGERAWEPLLLAAGYTAVPEGDVERRSLLPGFKTRGAGGVRELVRDIIDLKKRTAADAWLAGELAIEAGLSEDFIRRVKLCDALEQAMYDPQLPEPERAAVGIVLGTLGDPRRGVVPTWPPSAAKPLFCWSDWIGPVETFVMGGDEHAWNSFSRVEPFPPAVERALPDGYHVSRYPVTNAQFDLFEGSPFFEEQARRHGWKKRDKSNPRFSAPNQPVVNVTWHDAMRFCAWVNRMGLGATELGVSPAPEGQRWEVRLPTEAEWEYAARGPEGRWLPWMERANTGKSSGAPPAAGSHLQGCCNWHEAGIGCTSVVGLYPLGRSGCGADDMIGNVWEWTRSAWADKPMDDVDEPVPDSESNEWRVLRGGSWGIFVPGYLRCAARFDGVPWFSNVNFGFRVVCVRVSASGG